MRVYLVEESYSDYDDVDNVVFGVYASYADAQAAADVLDAVMKAANPKRMFRQYENYTWSVTEWEVQ